MAENEAELKVSEAVCQLVVEQGFEPASPGIYLDLESLLQVYVQQ